jgi:hypothetical protein
MIVYVIWYDRIMCAFPYTSLARQWCYERGAKDTDDFDTLVMPDGSDVFLANEIPF